jgi:hypothetical protein
MEEELIIKYLSEGYTQDQIAHEFQKKNITPNSVSSIEKKLRTMKDSYNAKTMFHLAWILSKEKSLIITDSRNGE